MPAVLERSLNELRRRHEILQVRFVAGSERPGAGGGIRRATAVASYRFVGDGRPTRREQLR